MRMRTWRNRWALLVANQVKNQLGCEIQRCESAPWVTASATVGFTPKYFETPSPRQRNAKTKHKKKTTHAIKGEKKREAPTNQENIRSQTYYSSRNFSGKRRMEIMPPTAWHSAVSQHRRSDERFSPVHQLFWGTYPPKPAFLVFEILLLEIVLTNEKPLMLKLGW